MKKILSLLMCYVFLQAETFALRGGPTGAGSGKVTGSFSGIMLEVPDPAKTTTDVGLFILSAAISGPSTGYLIIFSSAGTDSKVYNCKMTGLSDTSRGGSGTFYGLFAGTAASGAPPAITGGTTTGGTTTGGTTTAAPAAPAGGSIAGQMIAQISPINRRLTGTVVCGVSNATTTTTTTTTSTTTATAPTKEPLKNFTVDGWQTGDSSSATFSL